MRLADASKNTGWTGTVSHATVWDGLKMIQESGVNKQPSLYLYTDQYSDVKANTISMAGFQANKLSVTLENNLLAMGKIGLITDKKF